MTGRTQVTGGILAGGRGLRMGGVDALVAPDGRMWVLEVNHPCYFGHAQDEGGVDVAGAMVDWLLTRVGG